MATPTNVSGKEKEVPCSDGLTPSNSMSLQPLGFLNEKQVNSEISDDLMGFKEAGFLDMAIMEEKDDQALFDKNTEQKLYDYQFSILVDNKELNAKVKELSEAVSEREVVIRNKEAAHLIAISEAYKREENLRKMLELENRCRVDLEKAVCEIGEENEKLKLISQMKLADANNLLSRIEDKSIEVNKKMQEADAKLAAANTKSMELDTRFEEIKIHESMVQSERFSLNEERKGWEVKLSKQKDDLREWERKLCEMEMALERKEKELKDIQTNIDLSSSEAKRKEDDLNNRLANLIAKDLEAGSIKRNLETKEKELVDFAEKLDVKEREFDLEVEEKRKSVEGDLRAKAEVLDKKESEIKHREENLRKEEQTFDKKTERFKEKENDLETKMKELKEKEKSINDDTKKIDFGQKQILADKESLQVMKAEILEKELKLHEHAEKLKNTEGERTENARLQLELKQEIKICRVQRDCLQKQFKDLRNERTKFEEERAEAEKQFQAKEKAFEDEREKEFSKINYLKGVTRKEMEELDHERRRIVNEKEEISINRNKIKNEREEFATERSHFLAFVEKLKNCGKCGPLMRDFNLSDLQILEGSGDSPLSRTVDENIEKSEGLVSLFKKNVASFKLSSETVNESQQPELRSGRKKRSHNQTCLGSGDDMVDADSEAGSESVTKGERKKGRPTTAAKVCSGDTVLVKNTDSGENISGANGYSDDDNNDDDSGNDVAKQHPNKVSLGKKLWNFFST